MAHILVRFLNGPLMDRTDHLKTGSNVKTPKTKKTLWKRENSWDLATRKFTVFEWIRYSDPHCYHLIRMNLIPVYIQMLDSGLWMVIWTMCLKKIWKQGYIKK